MPTEQLEDTNGGANDRTLPGLLGASVLTGMFVIWAISDYLIGAAVIAGLAYLVYLEPQTAMQLGQLGLAFLAVCLIISAIVTGIGFTVLLFTEYNPIKDSFDLDWNNE